MKNHTGLKVSWKTGVLNVKYRGSAELYYKCSFFSLCFINQILTTIKFIRMIITVQVSITPLHLWDAELVGTSPLSWEAVWIIQASKNLQYPDLCKIPRIKGFRKPTTDTTVQNKLNNCMCWKNVRSSEETLYI